MVGPIDDFSLRRPFDVSVRNLDEALQVLVKPMIATGLAMNWINPLLHDHSSSFGTNDEIVHVELIAVLHGVAKER